ncbi:hypothetical protein BHM03_00061315 [Ensete ventricosum]|nr:hypothetical protein BHM03_00061315 [Ensete ventricosum]
MGVAPLRTGRGRVLPLLATGGSPCWCQLCPQASPLQAAASICRPLRVPSASLTGWLWSQPAAPLQGAFAAADLVVRGRPCMATYRGWPPLLLVAFAAKNAARKR